MATISEALALAMQHHQNGQLPAAEQLYRQILAVDPNQPDALHLLGLIAHQIGRHDAAAPLIQQAIAHQPRAAHYHSNLGEVYRHLGRLPDAIACYQRALAIDPQWSDALHNLSHTLQAQGRWAEAAECCRRLLALAPDDAALHNQLGVVEWQQQHFAAAIACYGQALALNPDDREARLNLGIALRDDDQPEAAAECFQALLARHPDCAAAHNNLGILAWRKEQGEEAEHHYRRALELDPGAADTWLHLGVLYRDRGQLDAAAQAYQEAVALRPDYREAHLNLATVRRDQGRFLDEAACYQHALRSAPDDAPTHNNLGVALTNAGEARQGAAHYRRAVELRPDYEAALYNLGVTHFAQRELAAAVDCFRRALAVNPDSAAALCALVQAEQHRGCWDEVAALSARIVAHVENTPIDAPTFPVSPFYFLALPQATTAAQQARCARRWAWHRVESEQRVLSLASAAAPRTHRRDAPLTIGYLSPDFRAHAVAWLIAELFERHDRTRCRIVGYSYGADDGSDIRRRIAAACDQFVDVRAESYEQTAARIRADKVDILVDLAGYTQHARTQILAHRPAPLAVNYLGYPGTLGTKLADYILVDRFVVPPEQQPHFDEQLVHLPHCYQPNDSHREIAARTPTRAECGLPESGFVFCSFNNNYKITPDTFDVWMELLRAVPGSVLWLWEGNAEIGRQLRRTAAAAGIAAERLIFAPHAPLSEHLARHRLADLFLDTFPYNAHTTASDALWAGLPLVTRAGETFASRVAGSLLRTIGLPELVTTSLAEYQALALRLATEPALLAGYRARLAANRATSPLFDAKLFARHLEQAYATMWERHLAGEPPQAFAVEE